MSKLTPELRNILTRLDAGGRVAHARGVCHIANTNYFIDLEIAADLLRRRWVSNAGSITARGRKVLEADRAVRQTST